jgi:HD-like signal output (HDOD) protein
MADLLAQRIPVHYPEGAFVGGLFHDLGKLLIAITSLEDYDALTRFTNTDGRTAEECEKEALGWTHAELSSAALEQWNLPQLIQMAVEFHHIPDAAPEELSSGKQYHLGHLLYAADQTVNRMGISLSSVGAFQEEARFQELRSLGLEAEIPEIVEEFDAEFSVLKAVS